VRRRFLVEGVVQGVGFRHFTWRLAGRLGLSGWARNLPDGSVEVVAEGDPELLGRLEQELKKGPSFAAVTNVRSSEISDEAAVPRSFEIR